MKLSKIITTLLMGVILFLTGFKSLNELNADDRYDNHRSNDRYDDDHHDDDDDDDHDDDDYDWRYRHGDDDHHDDDDDDHDHDDRHDRTHKNSKNRTRGNVDSQTSATR